MRGMLEWRVGGVRCRVSLLFPALVTGLLLRQSDGLALSCLLASVVHEGGHLAAMAALGCPPTACTLGAFGARLEMGRDRLTGYGRNILVSLAGPAVNALAALVLWWCGRTQAAAVHALLGAFNLLPAEALDGGQILRCLLGLFGQERHTPLILRLTSAAVLLPLAATAAYTALHGGNTTMLIVGGYLTVLIFFSPS